MRAIRDRRAGRLPALLLGLAAAATAALTGGAPAARAQGDGGGKVVHSERGKASFYGPGLEGKPTASGEKLDGDKPTAAHRELPLGTEVTVTNTETGEKVEVEVNDRGPHAKGRVIDLSEKAAGEIGITKEDGTAEVKVEATAAQVEEGRNDELGEGGAGGDGKDGPKRRKTAD